MPGPGRSGAGRPAPGATPAPPCRTGSRASGDREGELEQRRAQPLRAGARPAPGRRRTGRSSVAVGQPQRRDLVRRLLPGKEEFTTTGVPWVVRPPRHVNTRCTRATDSQPWSTWRKPDAGGELRPEAPTSTDRDCVASQEGPGRSPSAYSRSPTKRSSWRSSALDHLAWRYPPRVLANKSGPNPISRGAQGLSQ